VANRLNRVFEWPTPTHTSEHRGMAGRDARRLLPEPLFQGTLRPAVTVMEAIGDLPAVDAGEKSESYVEGMELTEYQRRMRGSTGELTLHESTGHSEKMLQIIRLAGKNRFVLPAGITTSGFSTCYSRLDANEPSTTITVNFIHPSSNRCIHPIQDRALTPREGARLQGFPDSYRFWGGRAEIVKQIGNAVPPIMGEVLAAAIAEQVR